MAVDNVEAGKTIGKMIPGKMMGKRGEEGDRCP
jgi:hypothetical protein